MIKNDLIKAICDELGGISTREVWDFVTFILEDISSALERGETVKITNFGVFETHQKNERIGRNPKTLKEVMIKSRRVVRFRKSDNVSEILNSDTDNPDNN